MERGDDPGSGCFAGAFPGRRTSERGAGASRRRSCAPVRLARRAHTGVGVHGRRAGRRLRRPPPRDDHDLAAAVVRRHVLRQRRRHARRTGRVHADRRPALARQAGLPLRPVYFVVLGTVFDRFGIGVTQTRLPGTPVRIRHRARRLRASSAARAWCGRSSPSTCAPSGARPDVPPEHPQRADGQHGHAPPSGRASCCCSSAVGAASGGVPAPGSWRPWAS